MLLAAGISSAHAQCPPDLGDITGIEGTVDVLDVQCSITVVLTGLSGGAPGLTPCLTVPLVGADLNVDGAVTVIDVAIEVALALDSPLGAGIDKNANGCPDVFEVECADGFCDAALGESCIDCPFDCGFCTDLCCDEHGGAGCAEAAVEDCVCAISEFCCTTLWDASCVSLAVEFCDPTCESPPCATSGELSCDSTFVGTTVGGSDVYSEYACSTGTFDGNERIYALTADEPGVQVDLTSLGGTDLRVFLLDDDCSNSDCIVSGTGTVQTPLLPGETVYIVVDAPAGSGGDFQLDVTCEESCDFEEECAGLECGSVTCGGESVNCGLCPIGFFCDSGECAGAPTDPCPGSGSCTSANDTPGCSNVLCCNIVCEIDGLCCAFFWDDLCAEQAIEECPVEIPGVCEPELGENCKSKPADCGCSADQECLGGFCTTEAACPSPTPLACNETLAVALPPFASASFMSNYSCSSETYSGPEQAYSFTSPLGATGVNFVLTPIGETEATLLFLGPDCNTTNCLQPPGTEISFPVDFEDLYHVVVEVDGPGAAYSLSVTCEDF